MIAPETNGVTKLNIIIAGIFLNMCHNSTNKFLILPTIISPPSFDRKKLIVHHTYFCMCRSDYIIPHDYQIQ